MSWDKDSLASVQAMATLKAKTPSSSSSSGCVDKHDITWYEIPL